MYFYIVINITFVAVKSNVARIDNDISIIFVKKDYKIILKEEQLFFLNIHIV